PRDFRLAGFHHDAMAVVLFGAFRHGRIIGNPRRWTPRLPPCTMAGLACPGGMMRFFALAMLLCFSASSIVNAAQPAAPAKAKAEGDPAVRQLLDKLEYKYDVDE